MVETLNDAARIWLDEAEIGLAAYVGAVRHVSSLHVPHAHGFVDASDGRQGAGIDFVGAVGELAAAKYTGLYWVALGPFRDAPGDVGPYQVRTTLRPNGRLLLHPSDPDDAPFILVIPYGKRDGRYWFRLPGWIHGRDGKRIGETDMPNMPRKCYAIPQTNLHPMRSLPSGWRLRPRDPAV